MSRQALCDGLCGTDFDKAWSNFEDNFPRVPSSRLSTLYVVHPRVCELKQQQSVSSIFQWLHRQGAQPSDLRAVCHKKLKRPPTLKDSRDDKQLLKLVLVCVCNP